MRTTTLSLIAASAVCLVMCSTTTAPSTDPSADTKWLDQLVGKWEGDVGGQRYVEEWRKLDANTYEGSSVTYDGEKVAGTENLRITLFSGHWLYLANPGGQGVGCFQRTSVDASTWIFENKEHDFPKRIGYRVTGAALTAWIAGANDQDNRMEFALKKVK